MARRNDFSQRGRASSPPIGAPDATQLGAKGSRALVAHAASSHSKLRSFVGLRFFRWLVSAAFSLVNRS
jgi:hypothetical protein